MKKEQYNSVAEIMEELDIPNQKIRKTEFDGALLERAQMIYKDPQAVRDMVQAYREDVRDDINAIKDVMQDEDEGYEEGTLEEYKRRSDALINDLLSGKVGTITKIDELQTWVVQQQLFSNYGIGDASFTDIYPRLESVIERFIGGRFYPDDYKGL